MWAVPETAAPGPGENVGSSVACIPATFMDASAAAKVPSGTKGRPGAPGRRGRMARPLDLADYPCVPDRATADRPAPELRHDLAEHSR